MNYKKNIDGLRALSILPVVFYHAGFNLFQGGFVGVDIFFVISGYLIAGIIKYEIDNNIFSLLNFYERRARRLVPPLFLMVLISIPFAFFWMLPDQLNNFSKSLVSISVFLSNFIFWLERGYFEASVELMPFIHTWSLSVEAQYYMVIPFFFLFLNTNKKLLIIFFIITLMSLLFSQYSSKYYPNANFYLIFSRVWEILLGAQISLSKIDQNKFSKNLSNIISLIGVFLIFYSIYMIDDKTPYPSVYTLLPVFGASFIIIFANPFTIIGKILSNRILVNVGLMSYSIYIWHQPILALSKLRSFNDFDLLTTSFLLAFSFIISWISFKYVEKPFRNKNIINRKSFFIILFSSSILIIFIGLIIYFNKGFESRISEETRNIYLAKYDNNPELRKCRGKELKEICKFNLKNDNDLIFLWGDSFVDQLMPMIKEVALTNNYGLMEYSIPGCPPLEKKEYASRNYKNCPNIDNVLEYISSNKKISHVLLHSSWQQHIEEPKNIISIKNIIDKILSLNKEIIIVGPIPEMDSNPISKLEKLSFFEKKIIDISTPYKDHLIKNKKFNLLIDEIDKNKNIHYIDPSTVLCDKKKCFANNGMDIFYRDRSHISVNGSKKLKNMLKQILDQNN
jgi:peptidoglycan/LPS O-acetylase OafA/YrhL